MPNHGHGIIWIKEKVLVGARHRRAPTLRTPTETTEKFGKPVKGSIPTILRAYKSAVTYAVNKLENQRGAVLWQKNYYEHIIRNERLLHTIARYIHNNPLNWQLDRDNAQNTRKPSAPEAVEGYIKNVEEMALRSSW